MKIKFVHKDKILKIILNWDKNKVPKKTQIS
jgi:hypothetical protein